MKKPIGYEEAQSFGEFETLPAGGYKCIIKKVVCEETSNGKEYLKIGFDIAEGEYKEFYQRKFTNDTRENPKWGGTWTVFVEGYKPNTTNPKFKGLITSIEESNENFKFDFDEQKLVNKKVGVVFREEEFLGIDGQVHTAVKPFFAVSYKKAQEAKIPNKKELSDIQKDQIFDSNLDNEELPF